MSQEKTVAYIDGEYFHQSDYPVYKGDDGRFFKSGDAMAKVCYTPAHYNPEAPEGMRGEGPLLGTWIYNEEHDKAEGVLQSNIELVMDSRLEAHGSVGLHQHGATEEIYYLLEGELVVSLQDQHGEQRFAMQVGDSHRIAPGQSHYIQAGGEGARFIVIAAKVNN